MTQINIEIKARTTNQDKIRELILSKNADFIGEDHQIDTYFKVRKGMLKLREGNIENNLIYYEREKKKGLKQSNITLIEVDPKSQLKELLTRALGVLVVVDKVREIYFVGNVKLHIDKVKGLGSFVEIEAISRDGTASKEELSKQCQYFLDLFDIPEKYLLSESYSDMLRKAKDRRL